LPKPLPKPAPAAKASVFAAHCPAQQALERIADKWTALVIYRLEKGPKRSSELQREIGGISSKMLTQTLRGLERDGLVRREVFPVIPPKVEYSLTTLGRTLTEPLKAICRWAEANMPKVEAARAVYDAANGATE
jgi:DNA-binding HxlR family transcriptional regulator